MGTSSSTNVVTHIRHVEDTRQQDMIRQQTQQLLRSEEEAEKEWHEVHTAFKENYDRTLQEFETGREMHKETFLQTCEAMNQRVQRELERNRQVRTDCERFLTAQIEAL